MPIFPMIEESTQLIRWVSVLGDKPFYLSSGMNSGYRNTWFPFQGMQQEDVGATTFKGLLVKPDSTLNKNHYPPDLVNFFQTRLNELEMNFNLMLDLPEYRKNSIFLYEQFADMFRRYKDKSENELVESLQQRLASVLNLKGGYNNEETLKTLDNIAEVIQHVLDNIEQPDILNSAASIMEKSKQRHTRFGEYYEYQGLVENRFGNFDCLCLSFLIGGGYWESTESQELRDFLQNNYSDYLSFLAIQYEEQIEECKNFDMVVHGDLLDTVQDAEQINGILRESGAAISVDNNGSTAYDNTWYDVHAILDDDLRDDYLHGLHQQPRAIERINLAIDCSIENKEQRKIARAHLLHYQLNHLSELVSGAEGQEPCHQGIEEQAHRVLQGLYQTFVNTNWNPNLNPKGGKTIVIGSDNEERYEFTGLPEGIERILDLISNARAKDKQGEEVSWVNTLHKVEKIGAESAAPLKLLGKNRLAKETFNFFKARYEQTKSHREESEADFVSRYTGPTV
ncbi:hypothetical protein [Legionella israelensis]|nr:hypothetical protein [Legionella israelensis]